MDRADTAHKSACSNSNIEIASTALQPKGVVDGLAENRATKIAVDIDIARCARPPSGMVLA
jgi:hypothetical protein